ncbi:MAG: hypothetical protein LBL01_06480, partial [Bifidobacteriaceae bacterium]|nr:hypothetical protein [Bifidobacteriaceae bacterium]
MCSRMRGGAAAVLAAAALAGCSGGSPQAVESGAPGGGPSAAVGDTGGAGNSGGLPQAQVEIESPVELPFAAYFEAGNQITETLARRGHSAAAQQHDKHEEFVASCMKDAG